MDLGRLTRSAGYRWTFFLSFLALLAERVWAAFWPVFSVLALFLSIAFMNVFAHVGAVLHAVLLTLFALAAILFCARGVHRFHPLSCHDTERAIERASGLFHRPLSSLRDVPVNPREDTAALWQKHLEQTRRKITGLRIYKPAPDTAAQDRFALRHAALLLLVIGMSVANGRGSIRLEDALTPDLSALLPSRPNTLDAWIEPPDYTHLPPVFLSTTQLNTAPYEGDIRVPQGSLLKIRISGHDNPPSLRFDGEKKIPAKADTRAYTLELPLEKDGVLKLRQGFRTLLARDIAVIPDTAPEISIALTDKTQQGALKITYAARDDYRIRRITADIRPEAQSGLPQDSARDIHFDVPVSAADKNGFGKHTEDLTYHIYAGMPVTLTLTAEDDRGQTAVSKGYKLLLPERTFKNSAARNVIFERKRLFWFDNTLTRFLSGEALTKIVNRPALYKGDIVSFMALASAIKRLGYDGDEESVRSVEDLLWDIALKLEDGGLSMAARDLREALQKLSSALDDKNTSKEEITQLSDEVAKKMQEYMAALAQEMQQRMAAGKRGADIPPEIADKMMQRIDMEKLMQELRDMNSGDAREQMRKMTEFFKNALDNLDTQKMDEISQQQQQAMEALSEMQDIIKDQQALMDKTGRKKDGEGTSEEEGQQSALRQKLESAVQKLSSAMPDLPPSLGEAGKAMEQAAQALKKGDAKGALPFQKEALEKLQQGSDESISEMSSKMQMMVLSFGAMPQGENYGEGYDPLGREDGKRGNKDEDILLPEEKERRRVQQIIEELRSRSNDYQRPKVERDYIDRLLDMFY